MISFYLKFFLTNILFSLIIASALLSFRSRESDGGETPGVWETLLYSLGLGPMFTVLLLYYQLLVLPGRPTSFYVTVVLVVFFILALLGRKGFVILWRHTRGGFQTIKNLAIDSKARVYWVIVLLVVLFFLWVFHGTVAHNRMEGHDALIYGNFGKMYYQEKKIEYEVVMLPAVNGFLFQGSPKPAFSLLLTWELMLNGKQIDKTKHFDAYYRGISAYYTLLILLVAFLWFYRKNRWFALFGTLLLFSGAKFYIMMLDHHLDSFRIFFLLVSWIALAYRVKGRGRFAFILLALFSGFAAFAHLIGFVIALINGLALLVFDEISLKKRLINSIIFFLIVMVLGGIHYFLEALLGTETGFINYFFK